MSSVLGHGLGASALYGALRRPGRLTRGWRGMLLAWVLGILPDLDVLARLLWPRLNHRGPSHSLLFAAASGLLAALLACRRRPRDLWRAWPALFLVAASHPFLDYLMGCGPAVPFFWPWSDKGYLSPVQLVPTAYYSRSLQGLLALLHHGPTLRGMELELIIFLPLVLLAWGWHGLKRSTWGRLAALALAASSAAGVYWTTLLY